MIPPEAIMSFSVESLCSAPFNSISFALSLSLSLSLSFELSYALSRLHSLTYVCTLPSLHSDTHLHTGTK